jgi:SNF2 family DNA or RNA helicase
LAEHWQPHPYQVRVVEEMLRRERLGLFLDPGLGKTAITLEAFRRLWADCIVSRLLVVAPLRPAYSVWPSEATKWTQFRHFRVHVLHGKGRTGAALARGVADIYVINPEGLPWLVEQRWEWPEMLAVDESTKFKRVSAGRSRYLKRILPNIPLRYILTGTPSPNGYDDLHGQIRILDDGAALGATLKEFRENFCALVPSGRDYQDWEVRTAAKPEIERRIAPLVIRLDARDYLQLPEKIVVDVPVALPDQARGLYEKLRKELVLRLAEGDIAAVNAGVLTAKCRQVANGSVYLTEAGEPSADRTRAWSEIHTAKAQALADLVEELGKPLLVAYEHHHDLEMIRRALHPLVGDVPHIGGGVSAERGAALERAWNEGRLRALALHPQSAAHGLNLQAGGHHLAWYSLPWDLELYDQLCGRLWRQGQAAERVFIYHLVTRKTVDEWVSRALRRKAGDQSALLDALRSSCVEQS